MSPKTMSPKTMSPISENKITAPKKAIKLFDFGSGSPVLTHNSKIMLSKDDTKNKNVISQIGQARLGKSFYLNCINTYFTGSNDEIFATESQLDHCTKDVNIYEWDNYIALDIQGLRYESSNLDEKLLLISYTSSDIVIINGTKTLDNTMFSYIEPISVYVHFLTKSKPRERKPVLVFKIMDYQFEENPDAKIKEQLEKLMKTSNDNYQTLRNTLKLLFENVYAVYTLPPDRSERKKFTKKDFKYALSVDDLNFKGSIENIIKINEMNNFPKISSKDFLEKCKDLEKDMFDRKEDKSFNISECDLSKLTAEKRCRTYFDNIRDETICINDTNENKTNNETEKKYKPNPNRSVVDKFKHLIVDENTDYGAVFVPQIKKIIKILGNFNEEFEDIDPNVVLNTLIDLTDHLFSGIIPKLEDMTNLIIREYKSINVDSIIMSFMDKYNAGISNYPSYLTLEDHLELFVDDVFSHCEKKLEKYIFFSEKRKKYEQIKSKIINNMAKKVTNKGYFEENKKKIGEMEEKSQKFINLCNFDANILIKIMHNALIEEIKQVKIYHKQNLEQIEKTKNGIKIKLDNYVQNKYVINYISKNKMNETMTYEQNVVEPIKTTIYTDLKQSDNDYLALSVISNIDISFKTNKCKITTKFATPYPVIAQESKSIVKKIWGLAVNILDTIKFNVFTSYYDKIDFVKLFHNRDVKSFYITKIKTNISNTIKNTKVSYDVMLKIREVNKELKIEFVSFSNSSQYIHNALRKKIVPHDGYLLLKDNYADEILLIDVYGNELKLSDILKHFSTTDNMITFDYVSDPNSEDRFLKYTMQQIIINALARDNLFKNNSSNKK
jgi:hypothetical protein